VRLFLQSPAAAALVLASHLSPESRTDAIDPAPLVAPRPDVGGVTHAGVGALMALALVGLKLLVGRMRRSSAR
jgi:hypothetical protein